MKLKLHPPSFLMWLCIGWIGFIVLGASQLRSSGEGTVSPKVERSACLSDAEKMSLPHSVASIGMPINWRVGAGDVAKIDGKGELSLAGKYLRCKIAEGARVAAADVAECPVISGANGKVNYLLNVTKLGSPENVNAEKHLQVFGARGSPLILDARVLALLCANPSLVVLEISLAESKLLDEVKLEEISVLVRKP